MSDPHGSGGGGGPKIAPGTLFAFLFLGGLGIYLFLLFLSMGIEAFGEVKRRYPEVIMGGIFLAIVVAFITSGKKDGGGGGGGGHH